MFAQAMEDFGMILLPPRRKILEMYSKSYTWERFGRMIAENVYVETADGVRDFLFRNPEKRYKSLLKQHPDIF